MSSNNRVNKILHWIAIVLLWALVAIYLFIALDMSLRHRAESRVANLDIRIIDSTANGHLVSSATVREWITRSGIPIVGEPTSKVNLRAVEELIRRNGFIATVAAYTTYSGDVAIDISQRSPSVRILVDGYNGYADSEGYVFPAPRSSSLYMPVVTGSYRPPYPSDYSGDIRVIIDEQIEASKMRVRELERTKYPHFERELEIQDSIKNVGRMFISQKFFESDELFKQRVVALRRKKADLRRKYRYRMRLVEEQIAAITAEQHREELLQKKLQKNYEDYIKLINFVDWIEDDSFWRSEVVQIEAETTPAGELEVELIPRSGGFVIQFGSVGTREQNEEKFERLEVFYNKGLGALGWDTYRTISVKYSGQVVCAK